jgi:hypothetical protein
MLILAFYYIQHCFMLFLLISHLSHSSPLPFPIPNCLLALICLFCTEQICACSHGSLVSDLQKCSYPHCRVCIAYEYLLYLCFPVSSTCSDLDGIDLTHSRELITGPSSCHACCDYDIATFGYMEFVYTLRLLGVRGCGKSLISVISTLHVVCVEINSLFESCPCGCTMQIHSYKQVFTRSRLIV